MFVLLISGENNGVTKSVKASCGRCIFGILFAPVATCFSVRALCLVVLLFSTRLTSSAFLWRYVAAVPTDFVCFTKFHFLVELGDGCFSVLAYMTLAVRLRSSTVVTVALHE